MAVENGAVVLTGGFAFAAARGAEHAGVASNSLTGGGRLPAGLVRVSGDVVAESNQCLFGALEDPSAVVLRGSSVIASANRMRGERSMLILQATRIGSPPSATSPRAGRTSAAPGAACRRPWQPLNPDVS